MNEFLRNLLSDRKEGELFRCFGFWHFFYIFLALTAIVILALLLRGRGEMARKKAATVVISVAFGLYVADFFLMPLAYGEIDVEKLPFHVCTATCVMCFLSRFVPVLRRLRVHFALLGFISNLVYLIYPAGVMWHAVGPASYRVIQTLLFHAIMTVYGFLVLAFDERLRIKNCYKDLLVVVGMTLWAMLGNAAYNGTGGRVFNWFFVVGDPFGLFPEQAAPFIMPPLNIALFFAVELCIYGVIQLLRGRHEKS